MKMKETISRLCQSLASPNDFWAEEKTLDENPGEMMNNFLNPVLITSGLILFIGVSIQTSNDLWLAFRHVLAIIITGNFGVLIVAYAISKLAPSFGGVSDFTKSFKLVVFSSFLYLLAISFSKIFPHVGYLFMATSLYGLFIFFVGTGYMLNIQTERKVGFSMICFLIFSLVFYLLDFLGGIVFMLNIKPL